MRVLFTGCTSIQISPNNRVGISKIDVPGAIVDALQSRGHEVDWRKVNPGEDLSGYDVAWVSLAPINSLNGRSGAMGTLWVLGSELPCVAFADDWQINAVFNGMRALARKPEVLTKYMFVGSADRGEEIATHWNRASAEAAMARVLERNPSARVNIERYYMRDTDEAILPHADRLVAAAQDFNEDRWGRGMVLVCPMYAWGNHGLIRKRLPPTVGPVEALDPSSTIYDMLAEHEPLAPPDKRREWVLGALMPHDAWIDRRDWTWPMTHLGSKTMIKRYGGQRLQTEADVIDYYNHFWGILSPPYPHAGSGWWRSRFMYAARVRSVLCCDRGEGDPLGAPYQVKHTVIEKMSDEELQQLAEAQAQALRPWMPDPHGFVEHCDYIIHRAYREDKGGARLT
jgi:hypothetical protein